MRHHQFNSFWHGNELSPLEWVCLSSFIEHQHSVRLFSYKPVIAPAGVSVEDAAEIVPRNELFLFKGSVSAFSNLFRYCLLRKYNEWWVDTDVYCLRNDIPDCRYAWAEQDVDQINGAVLKFPPNDPTLREITRAAYEIGSHVKVWGELGPDLLTKYLMASKFDGHFGKRIEFYPIYFMETFLFWLPDYGDIVAEKCRDSYFIHMWTSVFPQMGIDRYKKPPTGSFLEKIYIPHLPTLHLQETSIEEHNRTLESIKTYCNYKWVISSSMRQLGYDISKFHLEKFVRPARSFGGQEARTD